MMNDPQEPITTRARTDAAPADRRPLAEGLTALDQDLAGTMADEGGRSAQTVDGGRLATADVSLRPRRRVPLWLAFALGAAAAALLVREARRERPS